MVKIEKNLIEKNIEVVINALMDRGITAKINIKEISKDDSEKEKKFYKIITFDGVIKCGDKENNFNFFIAIENTNQEKQKDWSWLIANSFIANAACTFVEDVEKIKYFLNLKEDIVNKLIK